MANKRVSSQQEDLKQLNYTRRHVMVCALHILVVIWLLAAVCAYATLSYPETLFDSEETAWIPFMFIGCTILWVVLSRVISPFARMALFMVWVFSLVAAIGWGSNSREFGPAVVFASGTMAVIFTTLSIVTRKMNFAHFFKGTLYYFLTVAVSVGISYLFAPLILTQDTKKEYLLTMVIACMVVSVFQIWHTWNYLNYNPHLLQIHNTCLFAVMSPWTETVDTFATLSRFH